MPAKHLSRVDEKEVYLHIYNKGVEGREIFNDEQDFNTFTSYLGEYLTVADANKKTIFTVNGKTFKGTPHQPKNYFNKVELVAYVLMPDHFHLVLDQRAAGAVQSFIRSLCTRYSIYFNKKYNRKGSLFEGPYKSAHLKDAKTLVHLVTYLHTHHQTLGRTSNNHHIRGSGPEWLNINAISSLFTGTVNNNLEAKDYREFMNQKRDELSERQLLSNVIIEHDKVNLERRVLESRGNDTSLTSQEKIKPVIKKSSRTPEYLILALIFFGLFDLGMRNIYIKTVETYSKQFSSTTKATMGLPTASTNKTTTEVLSATDSAEQNNELSTLNDPTNLLYSVVVIKEGMGEVNIYNEQAIEAEVVTTAVEGDTLTAMPVNPDWYEVRFTDKKTGFIQSKYIKIKQIDK